MQTRQTSQSTMHHSPYRKLFWMALLSFIAMYILMYSMADSIENVIPNLNQFYMAGLMSMAMLVIELLIMSKMYPNKKLNLILITGSILLGLLFYLGIRTQKGIRDREFLKSMIPHHSAAVLMVEKSRLEDPEVKKLGQEIINKQKEEIRFMKRKLQAIEKK